MRRILGILTLIAGAFAMTAGSSVTATPDERTELLKVREAVWRAWFANDTKALEQLVPADTVVLDGGEPHWQKQADVFKDAANFQASGGKLVRLEFPRTEVQNFGDVAVTYSDFAYEIEQNGKRSTTSGRAMEVFVRRHGKWTNPGWHTDHNPQ
jgi:ketosteroid isomerase-like protein